MAEMHKQHWGLPVMKSKQKRTLPLEVLAVLALFAGYHDSRSQTAQIEAIQETIPKAIFDQMLASHKLVGSPGLTWKQHVITVAFTGGNESVYSLIESTANEWISKESELKLSFRDEKGKYRLWTISDAFPAADIRISFVSDGDEKGYWSVVGVLAQNVHADAPTMNLDSFPQKLTRFVNNNDQSAWISSYEHSVILHEFGHALGLSHEHFHPDCQKDLNFTAIQNFLMNGDNHWTYQQFQYNMKADYYFQALGYQASPLDSHVLTSPHIDQASVMLYSFSNEYYKSGAKSLCKPSSVFGYATKLSDGDRNFFATHYNHILSPF